MGTDGDSFFRHFNTVFLSQLTIKREYLCFYIQDNDAVCYDLKYALRLCSENGKDQAAVQIYSTMCLYEEAVELALKVDIEKAKLYADKPEYDQALRKKLWLKVARHVVQQKQDVGQ